LAIFDNDLSLESFSSLPSKQICLPFYCRLILIGPQTPSFIRNLLCLLSARYSFSIYVASSRSRLAVENIFSVPVLSTVGPGSILRFIFVCSGFLATHSEPLLVFSCFSSAFDRATLSGACIPTNLFYFTPVACRVFLFVGSPSLWRELSSLGL
jgi:hypothetical protein